MTQRNNHPQTLQAMPIRMDESLRVALELAPIAAASITLVALVLVVLITVLTSAGFGYV